MPLVPSNISLMCPSEQSKFKIDKEEEDGGMAFRSVKKRSKKIPCTWAPSALSPAPPQKAHVSVSLSHSRVSLVTHV
jgi:hypothetical protein